MFSTLRNAWMIPDLRKKIFMTIILLIIFRIGAHIPVPGVNPALLQSLVGASNNSLFGMMDMMSGGAFSQATIFAMSITPYINASIIMNLLTVAVPYLERLKKEGETGRKKIAQYTRYGTVVLALIQAFGLYTMLAYGSSESMLMDTSFLSALVIVISLTAGTAFLMWLGEQITDKGVGNGISLIIFAGIVSRIPSMAQSVYRSVLDKMYVEVSIMLIIALAVIGLVVAMNEAERRIPVQYAKRVIGRKMVGGQSSHIPIKVASAGVIPIIFAMSIMAFPGTIAALFGGGTSSEGFWGAVLKWLSPDFWLYGVLYFFLILFFTYFYTAIQFNPIEMANNMKRNGGFIPGIRPGKPTSDFISRILSKITMAGAIFLGFVATLPIFIGQTAGFSGFAIGGTSLLIVVSVALETVRQLESQMLMRHYKGFLE